jgi:hypothetical protein
MTRWLPLVVDVRIGRSTGTFGASAWALLALGLASAALLLGGVRTVNAQTPSPTAGGVNATVNVAQRSITVSPGAVAYADCNSGVATALLIPNGFCRAPSTVANPNVITVTNGAVSSNIRVSATDFVGGAMGTPWDLCRYTLAPPNAAGEPVCSGTGLGGDLDGDMVADSLPGADQSHVHARRVDAMFATLLDGPPLLNVAACDRAFAGTAMNSGSCAAASGQSASEQLQLIGPASSTDPATTFSQTVTWAAFP